MSDSFPRHWSDDRLIDYVACVAADGGPTDATPLYEYVAREIAERRIWIEWRGADVMSWGHK